MTMTWQRLLSTTRLSEIRAGGPRKDEQSGPNVAGRTEFERDYGRAVFSSPVRRLQDKAQVFPLDPTDAVRTRLTHSMEVSSVARGIARLVARNECDAARTDEEGARAIEVIAATAALLHDIGNPPFGHAGEGAIRDWFANNADAMKTLEQKYSADFKNFEGNAQTLRLVSRLQFLVKDEGLNLTCATMAALQKYVATAEKVEAAATRKADDAVSQAPAVLHAMEKPGFFQSEMDLVESVREQVGLPPEGRHPVALIMEAADDICFAVVDIEDGVKKGIVDWASVVASLREVDPAKELVKKAEEYVGKEGASLSGKALDEALIQTFRVHFIGRAVTAAAEAFAKHRAEVFEGAFHEELVMKSACGDLLKACKKFARRSVYPSSPTLKLELLGRRVIADLMTMFWMGASKAGPNFPNRDVREGMAIKSYSLMSENYRRIFERNFGNGLPDDYLRLQLVTDQVCGMTDGYACRIHSEVMGG